MNFFKSILLSFIIASPLMAGDQKFSFTKLASMAKVPESRIKQGTFFAGSLGCLGLGYKFFSNLWIKLSENKLSETAEFPYLRPKTVNPDDKENVVLQETISRKVFIMNQIKVHEEAVAQKGKQILSQKLSPKEIALTGINEHIEATKSYKKDLRKLEREAFKFNKQNALFGTFSIFGAGILGYLGLTTK